MTSQGPRNDTMCVVAVHYHSHSAAGVHSSNVLWPDWRKEEFHETFAIGS